MEFKELVLRARSYRRFDGKVRVPGSVLEEVIDIARNAPSPINFQLLRYAWSTEKEVNARIFSHLRWAGLLKDWSGPAEGERPTGYIVIGGTGPDNANRRIEAGIAGQTLQLGLTAAGYGCCMVSNMQAEAVHEIVGFPEDVSVLLVLAAGKPAEEVMLETVGADGKTAYWRDGQGGHHVPKRALETVILARFPG